MQKIWPMLLLTLCMCSCVSQSSPEQVWIDVRSAEEYAMEHRQGAINIEFSDIVAGVAEAGIDKDTEILLYCGSGRRAGIALQELEQAGFSRVINRGGVADVLP